MEEWRCIERPEEVQQLLSSLRPMGERENQLQKALMEVVPRMETAMRKVRGEEEPTVAVKEEEEGEAKEEEAAAEAAAKAKEEVDDEDEEEDDGKSSKKKSGGGGGEKEEEEAPAGRWTLSGWRSIASRALQISQSEERLRSHRELRALVVPTSRCGGKQRGGGGGGGANGAPLPILLRCKLQMVDVFNAMPIAPPEVPT